MLENLLSGLKGEFAGELTKKIGIPIDKVDDVMKIAGQVASTEVTKEATSGGLDTIMNLFSKSANNSSANSLQDNIVKGIVTNLISKVGLDASMANMAANYLVPMIMEKVTGENSTTPDNDASPITKMFGLATGGKSGGLMDTIGSFFN